MLLSDRTAIVTGATRGIGLAVAESFASHGALVYVNARSLEEAEIGAAKLSARGYLAKPLAFDVSDPEEVKAAFNSFRKDSGKLDVLVNNAGILQDALIGMVSRKQIADTFGTNSYSVIYTSQYASRLMSRSGGGSIVNIASIIGLTGNVGQTVYAGSKSAVIGITKSLAKELAVNNIRVNAVAPGFIDTDMARSIPKETFEKRVESIALNRIGSAEEVASTVLYLASNMASYVTGQVIGVDGGMLV